MFFSNMKGGKMNVPRPFDLKDKYGGWYAAERQSSPPDAVWAKRNICDINDLMRILKGTGVVRCCDSAQLKDDGNTEQKQAELQQRQTSSYQKRSSVRRQSRVILHRHCRARRALLSLHDEIVISSK